MKGNSQKKIGIIGAGVSGLIAALELEKAGFAVTIFEKTDRVGGRVKTDLENGVRMDHGFQVLLEAYPMTKSYLDYKALDLKKFLPGAVVYKNGNRQTLGDPLRELSLLLPTLFSSLGTLSDKFKILALNRELKHTSIDTLFTEKETTTLQYLSQSGFSDSMINNFFRPFFSGIFLEPNLETSSRMFRFVYKMFRQRASGPLPNSWRQGLKLPVSVSRPRWSVSIEHRSSLRTERPNLRISP